MSDWREEAACRGRNSTFYPGVGEGYKEAEAICARCPVKRPCLESAMVEETGIPRDYLAGMRGGLTPWQRFELRYKRRKAA